MKPLFASRKESFCWKIYRPTDHVIAAPAVSVAAGAHIAEQMQGERPQTVFLAVDRTLTVRDADGAALGSLYDLLDLTRRAVPVLCLTDPAAGDPLSDFVWEHALGDAALCVPFARAAEFATAFLRMPYLRRMLDCRALGQVPDWIAVSETAWSVGAIGLLLSADQTGWETLNLLHERLHSVWCDAPGKEAQAIFAGVDGVLTDCPARVYEIYSCLPEYSKTDRYRILAHKGYQDDYRLPENSVQAVLHGADVGLDGAEIDVKLTRDGVPFVIHNPSTKGMLKGEDCVVEILSAAELESRERTDFPGVYTDRLQAMLQAVSGRQHYPIFIEFKPAAKFYHIERMAHEVRRILKETGTERGAVVLGEAVEMPYLSHLLPGQPKLAGVWEKPDAPQTREAACELLWRLWSRVTDAPAGLCVEDVMVNRLFGEEAALRGIRTVVWTRSWYFAPSRWEQDGARSDEGFLSGFQATISDHAGHYLQIPLRLETAPGGSVTAVMRDGSRVVRQDAKLFPIEGGQQVPGVWIPLPTGDGFYLFGEPF